MPKFIIILLVILGIVGLYIITYYFNSKMEKPEGIEEVKCESCHSLHCSIRNKDGGTPPDDCEIEKMD